jgi:hypothetical protein
VGGVVRGRSGLVIVAEDFVFSLILIVLGVFAILSLLLAAWTLFFQGYIYSEPVAAIHWRAPAAAGALTLFLIIWVFLDYGSIRDRGDEGRYRPGFEFSPRETQTYNKLTIVNRDRKKESYERRGTQYVNPRTGRGLPERPLEVIALDKDNQEHVFKPKMDNKGRFQEENGKVRYYEEGNPKRYVEEGFLGQISIFHFGWLVMGLLLHLGFLAVWFVALWLLLRFQWAHALGLAFVAWLISLFVLPMLLTQAEKVRKERLPPPRTARSFPPASLRDRWSAGDG